MVRRALDRLKAPLPAPPGQLRRGPFRAGAFTSRLHHERVAARLGVALGVAFGVCLVTGLVSHYMQQPPSWFTWPSRPVSLYRVNQGLHVLTGLAAVPLLVAKLWTIYPLLFQWPPVRTVLHAIERGSVLVLVGAAVFELFTGVADIAYWYPFQFFFPRAHFWTAIIATGAILVHIGVKLPISRRALRRAPAPEFPGPGLSRRGFLTTVGAASGVVVAATAGATVPGLERLTLLGARRPDIGPQGLPVNKTARSARIQVPADYRLRVVGPRPYALTYDELAAMPQHTVSLPIACVEGWSAGATWTGVRVRDLLDRAGIGRDASVRVMSLQQSGLYKASVLDPPHARDRLTLLALRLHEEPLVLDHGYPCRLIAPNRPGVLQTKWVTRLEVVA